MKLYKIEYCDDTIYSKLYDLLERSIGNFIIDGDVILFYGDKIKKNNFTKLNVIIKDINPEDYRASNKLSDAWIKENYRKFKVEQLLRNAEEEKQEELSNLYNVIKKAEEIIDRKEDLVDEKRE